MAHIKKSSGSFSVLLGLFSLPFAAVGVVTMYLAGMVLWDGYRMQSWLEVPAQVTSADLDSSRGSKGSVSYRVVGAFTYSVNGQQYQSNTVSRDTGHDNLGSFHQDAYAVLQQHLGGEPITAYVNEDNPEEAVIFRDIRWGKLAFFMAFAIVFGGVGFGLLAANIASMFAAKTQNRLEEKFPSQPWMARPDWAQKKVRSENKTTAIVAVVLALVVNGISLPVVPAVFISIADKGEWGMLFLLMFPLIGAAVFYWAVIAVLRWRKFGSIELELAENPIKPGSSLRGNLRLPSAEGFIGKEVLVTLECRKTIQVRSGGKTSTRTESQWKGEQRISANAVSRMSRGVGISIDLPIPENLPSTSSEYSGFDGKIDWELTVSSEVRGVDLWLKFAVPVFQVNSPGTFA